MAREYIITMTAENRVGIMSAVTKAMTELGGDLREASQTVVRGFFTMIFSAGFPDSIDPGVIQDHLQDAGRPFGIDLNIKETVADKDDSQSELRLYSLRLGGDNQPGILRQMSSTIAMQRIDIAGMHAVRTRNGDGFEMVMKIAVPRTYDVQELVNQLNQAGQVFNITADVADYS